MNSTVVPYAGVSMIDFRFRLARCPSRETFVEQLKQAMDGGALQHLYGMDEVDRGPQVHNGTTFFVGIRQREHQGRERDQVYLPAYFDNENSVNRYFDLIDYLSTRA